MSSNPPKRIAILRTAALGDICMTIPLLVALRDHFQDSQIYWIIDESMFALVNDLEGIELIQIKKPRSLRDWLQYRQKLSSYHFDVLLMPQSSMRSNLLSLFIKADVKYGFGKLHSKDFQSLFINQAVTAVEEHLVDSFLRFAECLGVPQAPPRWEIALSESDKARATDLIPSGDRPVIAICPVSSKQERNWSIKRFTELAKRLQTKQNAQIVLVGGGDKTSRNACNHIRQHVDVIDTSGQTSLKELCAILARCDILVAPDTGPGHLANAMGTPVVGLYAVMKAAKTGPYYSVEHCIDRYDEGVKNILKKDPSKTSWNLRVHSAQAMDLIQVDDVYQRCCKLLETNKRNSHAND